MKGPAIFLVALAGAAAFGWLLLRPALAEREALRAKVRALDAPEAAPPPAFLAARDRLKAALGPSAGDSRRRAATIALDHSDGVPFPVTESVWTFVSRWDRIPSLLADLEAVAEGIRSLSVTPGDTPEACRVRMVFAASDR